MIGVNLTKTNLLKIFVDNKNPEQVAKDYVDDNDNKVDEWLEGIETN